jgi:hypothetical protein
MAPIIIDQSSSGSPSSLPTTAIAAAHHSELKREHHRQRLFSGEESLDDVTIGDDDCRDDGSVRPRIGETTQQQPQPQQQAAVSSPKKRQQSSSLFINEYYDQGSKCISRFFEDDDDDAQQHHQEIRGGSSGGDNLKTSALMASFDALEGEGSFDDDALEDVDLVTSPRSGGGPPCHDKHHHLTLPSFIIKDYTIFSTDEELAKQLQVEEDLSAKKLREQAAVKAKNGNGGPALLNVKKSWLDDLLGEPFPNEVRRNYGKANSSSSGSRSQVVVGYNNNSCSSGLMAAIAAADAKVTAAALESSLLVDNLGGSTSKNLSIQTRPATTLPLDAINNDSPCNRSLGQEEVLQPRLPAWNRRRVGLGRKLDHADEGINQLSTSISKWWNNAIAPSSSSTSSSSTPASSTSTTPAAAAAAAAANTKAKPPPQQARFIDNGRQGIYYGDFLTDPTTNTVIKPLQRHGQGSMQYPQTGDTFVGNFYHNKYEGWGIYLWCDGDKQRGTWKDGLRHGPCIFHHASTNIIEYGYYNMGTIIGVGVLINAERTTAWKLVGGKKLHSIEMDEAERIVKERFECFPIPPAIVKNNKKTKE